jgi:hypothetical protein
MGALYRSEEATAQSSAALFRNDWDTQVDSTATNEYGLRSAGYSEFDNIYPRNIPVQLAADHTQTGEFQQDISVQEKEENGYLNEASQAQARASSEASSRAESEYWRPTLVPEIGPMYFNYPDLSPGDAYLTQAQQWNQTYLYPVGDAFDVSTEGSSAGMHSQYANGGVYNYPQDGSRHFA